MHNFKTLLLLIASFIVKDGFSQFSPRYVVDSAATGITEIITSDLNNDNLKDILVSQKYAQNNKIVYYLNQEEGLFGDQQILDSNIYFPLDLASADFDGNGWNDIVTFSGFLSSGNLFLYMNNSAVFSSQVLVDTNLYYAHKVKTVDIDKDSDEDIILISDTALIVYYNDDNANFTKTVIPPGIITEYYEIEIGDIDNDGFKDIVIGGVKTMIYKNSSGIISFDSVRTASIPDNNNLVFLLHLNDFDNDGDLDLVTDKNGLNIIQWYSNDGFGNFSSPISIDSNVSQCFSMTSGDFDDDGDIDLFTALPQLGEVVWYQNNGSGNFSLPMLVYQGSIPKTDEVFSDDLNNDNLPDVIWSQALSVHFNNSNGLDVERIVSDKIIEIYPNPASSQLNITMRKGSGALFVYNILGQAVISDYNVNEGFNVVEIDLVSGNYVIIIESEDFLKRQKLIIE